LRELINFIWKCEFEITGISFQGNRKEDRSLEDRAKPPAEKVFEGKICTVMTISGIHVKE
jgi:hypothetical protein